MHTRRDWLRSLVGLSIFTPSLARAKPKASAAPRAKRVLFVCTGNFYRSRYAQAAFNEKAPTGWTATSRGLDISTPRTTPVSPLVVADLEKRHIDLERVAGSPTALTRADLDGADIIVLLDGAEQGPQLQHQFPDFPMTKVRSWSVKDVPKMSASNAFAEIWKQTEALIAELAP